MRIALRLYLILYFALVAGAAAAVWRSGLIEHLHRGWTLAAFAGAAALGGLLALASRR